MSSRRPTDATSSPPPTADADNDSDNDACASPAAAAAALSALDLSKLLDEEERLETFADWPHERPSATLLAAAGFYFPVGTGASTGTGSSDSDSSCPFDEVRCPRCDATSSGFGPDSGDVWKQLAHRSDCALRPKLGEARNRSCIECHSTFSTVGSKLNHCKRTHPKPEEERLKKRAAFRAMSKKAAWVAATEAAADSNNSSGPSASDHAFSYRGNKNDITHRQTEPKKVIKIYASSHIANGRTRRRRVIRASPCDDAVDKTAVEDGQQDEPHYEEHEIDGNGLSFVPAVTVVACEPCVWAAGEVVLTRAEFREFREHIRAMVHIFRDIEPKRATRRA